MAPEEDLVVHCDGGARGNPGPASAACVIEDNAEKVRFLCGKYLGVATNNQAEYEAVALALKKILSLRENKRTVRFYLDSELVVRQLSGEFRVKNTQLAEIFRRIKELEKSAGEVSYIHVPREENQEADRLVNSVLDSRADLDREEPLKS
jgi:ribonuclease HI